MKRIDEHILKNTVCLILNENGTLGTKDIQDELLDYGVVYSRQVMNQKLLKFSKDGYIKNGMVGSAYVWSIDKYKASSFILHKVDYDWFTYLIKSKVFRDTDCMLESEIYFILDENDFEYPVEVKRHFLNKMQHNDELEYVRKLSTNWRTYWRLI